MAQPPNRSERDDRTRNEDLGRGMSDEDIAGRVDEDEDEFDEAEDLDEEEEEDELDTDR